MYSMLSISNFLPALARLGHAVAATAPGGGAAWGSLHVGSRRTQSQALSEKAKTHQACPSAACRRGGELDPPLLGCRATAEAVEAC